MAIKAGKKAFSKKQPAADTHAQSNRAADTAKLDVNDKTID